MATGKKSWIAAFQVYMKPEVIRMLFLGFSSGLPLLLILGTLSFWLREAGIDLQTIGMMSWVGLVYGFKWLWAPLVDRFQIPFLFKKFGRRRSWLLSTQVIIALSLFAMGRTDPAQELQLMVWLSLLTAWASATQDIALDAYRIESARLQEQAALAATYQTGYRLGMIWAGAGALALAAWGTKTHGYDPLAWQFSYTVMACSVSVGFVTVFFSREPENPVLQSVSMLGARLPLFQRLSRWFQQAVCMPFIDFFSRYQWQALLILMLIASYRISDVVMGVMANPFYQDLGFSKQEVAAVSKVFGVVMTLFGAFIGGVISVRIGVLRTLFLGGALSALTNLLFAWLATQGHNVVYLVLTVSADNLAAGIASVAFLAYLAGLTNKAYTATQYAIFSSIMLLLPKFLAGFSGFIVESVGYSAFFVATAAIGLPVLLLIAAISRTTKP
ncbi:MAG TPA: MFS transporter [Candidatus Aphodousia faecipullorum]|nr:MFS transporter [Candidatus Aphodousia faecipullorum]